MSVSWLVTIILFLVTGILGCVKLDAPQGFAQLCKLYKFITKKEKELERLAVSKLLDLLSSMQNLEFVAQKMAEL